ncbi:alanine racemase [Henriciella sp. AS95]|uniref:alanine racemase n=1 Tax=Henriciella sp. AS95 TaxID=3135782 RepID=UPI00316C9EBA
MSLHPRATIHLDNIVANWRTIGALTPASETGAVVKANAYGHGVAQVAGALHNAGCRTFFVAYVEEGAELREAVGPDAKIMVFNGAQEEDRTLVRDAQLVPVLNSLPAIDEWVSYNRTIPFAVHIDTGMNRLGVRPDDVARMLDLTRGTALTHVMSHLVDSDDPKCPLNTRQCYTFGDLIRPLTSIQSSLANTGGCFLGQMYGFDVTRPGIGLYGGGPRPPEGVDILPGMTLEAPILTVQKARPDETVGYGATCELKQDTLLATVALGYGDGFPRSAGNQGVATLGGIRCPIMGRVSMDLITIDVSAASDLAKPGGFAQFIGPDAPLEEQAKCAGTVGYELVTGLGHRVRRLYD